MAAAIRNRHPAPTHRSMTLAEAKAGLHSHALLRQGMRGKAVLQQGGQRDRPRAIPGVERLDSPERHLKTFPAS